MTISPLARRHIPWAWGATATLALILCALTLYPAASKAGVSGLDKLYHFIGFGALALPLCLAYPRRAWAVVLGVTAFGGAIELIQPYVGRGAEWADLLADALGALSAAGLARVLSRRR
ncbi:VanZ family protein [Pelagivirga sediminicola]|uniref:VanZ family protein n=1 Tax=Pelagivirga sediminicola TaxID=2170575 RepID=A0A2T7G6N2_9RHOB|nr:VanZ family protein [Pelagivirga sediminicola]PVA10036.1 VanZ family protein [Pelagivirga sediminicola]